MEFRSEQWNLPVSAKPVRPGDMICTAPGWEARAMLIRPSEDCFSTIMISITTPFALPTFQDDIDHELVCVWDWGEMMPANIQCSQDLKTILNRINAEYSTDGDEEYRLRIHRLKAMSLALDYLHRHGEAGDGLRQVLEEHESFHGGDHQLTVAALGELALLLKKAEQ